MVESSRTDPTASQLPTETKRDITDTTLRPSLTEDSTDSTDQPLIDYSTQTKLAPAENFSILYTGNETTDTVRNQSLKTVDPLEETGTTDFSMTDEPYNKVSRSGQIADERTTSSRSYPLPDPVTRGDEDIILEQKTSDSLWRETSDGRSQRISDFPASRFTDSLDLGVHGDTLDFVNCSDGVGPRDWMESGHKGNSSDCLTTHPLEKDKITVVQSPAVPLSDSELSQMVFLCACVYRPVRDIA